MHIIHIYIYLEYIHEQRRARRASPNVINPPICLPLAAPRRLLVAMAPHTIHTIRNIRKIQKIQRTCIDINKKYK